RSRAEAPGGRRDAARPVRRLAQAPRRLQQGAVPRRARRREDRVAALLLPRRAAGGDRRQGPRRPHQPPPPEAAEARRSAPMAALPRTGPSAISRLPKNERPASPFGSAGVAQG